RSKSNSMSAPLVPLAVAGTIIRGTDLMANQALKTVRLALWGLVLVAGGAVAGIWYFGNQNGQQAVAARDYMGNEQFGAGDYELVTHTGETVDDAAFTGAPALVFFGFTHCPDVCPTTLA